MKKKKKPTTITIRAFGEAWQVPRGFGRIYRDFVRAQEREIAQGRPGMIAVNVISALERVGYTSDVHTVNEWPARRRIEAIVWAATEHARAGDNPVQRHPRPTWLTALAWQGPELGKGIWQAPSPTEIR